MNPKTKASLQNETWKVVLPLLVGFIFTAICAFTLMGLADALGWPGWSKPLLFLAPGLVFTFFVRWYLPRLKEVMNRAAPSPEAKAAQENPTVLSAFQKPLSPDDDEEDDSDSEDYLEFLALPTLETEPGRTFPHLLGRYDSSPFLKLVKTSFFMLFWNGIVSVFLYQAIFGKGNDWCLRVFLIPFVIVGLVLIFAWVGTLYYFLVSLLVGKIRVELSRHPLEPGEPALAIITQNGLFKLNNQTLHAVCEESATYTQGTSTTTDTKDIKTLEMIPQGDQFEILLPPDTMHSFQGRNNKISWKVQVTGNVLGLFNFWESFGVLVVPRGAKR